MTPSQAPWHANHYTRMIHCACGNPIAKVLNRGSDVAEHEVANASLMAAASELLAVLKDIVESTQLLPGREYDAARAAIAKATLK